MLPISLIIIYINILGFILVRGRHLLMDDVLSQEQLKEYTRDGSAIHEFDIISPQFISHDVFKRSTEHLDSNHPSKTEVKYTAFGTDYNLLLEKNDWLVRKGLQVEILKADGTIERKPISTTDCHYFGRLSDHKKSVAAISLCNGMHGMVSHNRTDFVIQPLKGHHIHKVRSRRDVEHPHIIYKRTVTQPPDDATYREKHHSFCSYEAPVGYHPTSLPLLSHPPGPASISQRLPFVGQKYLELLIVADKDMVDFHGNDTENYIFALMNIVSRRYAHQSLEITLRMHIVKFILLESDSPTFQSSSFTVTGSSSTLDDFCAWQSTINPVSDSHPEHWDNAILLTRKNLFSIYGSDKDYSLLGKAYLSSTCRRGLQCSFNQDDGLGSSLIIAHETGHTLGLNHDDDYGCVNGVNIMSSWRPAGVDSFTWSPCSRANIRSYIGGPLATCLNDVPSNSPLPVDQVAGVRFDINEQCALALGPGAETCLSNFVNCNYLRCRNSTGCFSLGVGVMDGTTCGQHKWCISGTCVAKEALPDAVDGGWSEWDINFGECSRTCGGGARMRLRYCTHPTPQHGGRSCDGSAEQHEACNFEPCENNQDNFRDEQCSDTNDLTFNGNNYTWLSFTSGQTGDNLCTKRCLSNDNFWANRPPYRYIDGTRCWHGDASDTEFLNICVSGKCQQFGCDGKLGSGMVYDVCRQCNARGREGRSCQMINGRYENGRHRKHTTFLELPVGATSIEVNNGNLAYTHMAVLSGTNTIFEGHLYIPPPARRYGAGSDIIEYLTNYTTLRERIVITGPLSVPLTLQVYLLYNPVSTYGVNVRPEITYRYYVPRDEPVHEWEAGEFGECSVTCGNGQRTRSVRCLEYLNNIPSAVHKSNCPGRERPSLTEECHEEACPAPAQWVKTGWTECNVPCGDGYQSRTVHCQRNNVITPGECRGDEPKTRRRCHAGECAIISDWRTGQWSECNVECGDGSRHRTVTCQNALDNTVDERECNRASKPRWKSPCQKQPCNVPAKWITGPWIPCDVPCGVGTRTRFVGCRQANREVTTDLCDPNRRPYDEKACEGEPCISEWQTGPWSECSVSCGQGSQSRTAECEREGNTVTRRNCEEQKKPRKQRTCHRSLCPPPAQWIIGDWSECSTTCDNGTRERVVECRRENELVESSSCEANYFPENRETCLIIECPPPAQWTAGTWSECSVTCGDGITSRDIRCQRGTDQVHDSECELEDTPKIQRECSNIPCPTLPPAVWETGAWSKCNAACGQGTQSRYVSCLRNGEDSPHECIETKPITEQVCNDGSCLDNRINPENEMCNQLLTVAAGSYSQSHPTGMSGCTTTLAAPFGKSFSVTINSIIDCTQGEYLKIKEGNNERNICGRKTDFVINLSDNVISIVVKTALAGNGYALSYERRDGTPSNSCDRLYLNPTGTIKSPSYPKRYPSNSDCKYRIVTEPGRRLGLTFSRFSLQGSYPTCRYDKLEISDFASNNLLRYCGSRNQLSLVTAGNDLLLRFITDGRVNYGGFKATFAALR